MRPTFTFLISLLTLSSTIAQTCDCTINDVVNNTVESCQITIGTVDTVSTMIELKNAIIAANNAGGDMTILLEDGEYQIASTSWYPYITASNVVFRSLSGNRNNVILTGHGMQDVSPNVENCFYLVGDNITIADLTIRDVGNHGIAMQSDNNFVHNVRIQDTFEQMIKGTSAGDGADNALVQCSLFEYTAGIGPQWYIGGLDIHKGNDWVVKDNLFMDISSPSGSLAEHAVHFWNNSADNTVERNWIINCDRGVGFGLGSSPASGGVIRNNMIYNNGNGQFDDVGIGLETCPYTKVYNNTVYIQYANAIEYRFVETQNVTITNNLTNKLIKSRNGGTANLGTNYTQAQSSWFMNTSAGDLRLAYSVPEVVDQGDDLTGEVSDDLFQWPRTTPFDHGAHEYPSAVGLQDEEIERLTMYPNPTSDMVVVSLAGSSTAQLQLLDNLGRVVRIWALNNGSNILELADLPVGVYFVRGQIEDEMISQKLVVERN